MEVFYMELKDYKEVYDSLVMTEEADQRVLNGIREKGGEAMKRKYYKPVLTAGRIVAALAAIIITGTVVYAATEMWDINVAKKTGVSDKPEIREKMSNEGFSQYTGDDKINYSVTDKDITVSVIQTLADRYCADIYIEADFGSKYITEGNLLDFGGIEAEVGSIEPEVVFKCNGKVLDRAILNGVSKVVNNHKAVYRYQAGYYGMEELPEDAEISMQIDNFVAHKGERKGYYKVVTDGNWDIKWKLSFGTERRIYNLDHKIKTMDMNFKLKEFDVSPLSYSILLEEDGWTAEEREQFKKCHKNNAGIVLPVKGITTGYSSFMSGGICYLVVDENKEGKLFIREGNQFGQILDLEKITGISIYNNNIVEYISLEDCTYKIEK